MPDSLYSLDRRRCGLVSLRATGCEMYAVSLVELIARPELYHGKRVEVIGYLRLEFEGNAIYLSREDGRRGITRNGLWVSFAPDVLEPDTRYSDRYVLVEGTFDANNGGHMGLWSGSIEDITGVVPWR